MDLQRKVELMKRYNFNGIGNAKDRIHLVLNLFGFGENSTERGEELLSRLQGIFSKIDGLYGTIDFDELERENAQKDNDFATLFRTREILPRLQSAIAQLSDYSRSHHYHVTTGNETYRVISELQQELTNADHQRGVSYRARLRDLEKRLEQTGVIQK